ncbi:MAG: hypothetical protein WC108_07135 [Bacteroidales bacterium]|jgi:hypothetical protein
MRKNLGGRPSKMTKEVVKKLEEAFALDATVVEACFYANISRETFYNWMKADNKLCDRLEELRANPVLTARKTVVKSIEVDPDMAMKYLERKRKKEFSTRIETDNTNREVFDDSAKEIKNILEEIRKVNNANNGIQNREGEDVETSTTGTDREGEDNSQAVS